MKDFSANNSNFDPGIFCNNLGPENYFPIIFYSIFIQFTIPIVDFGLSQSFQKNIKKEYEKIELEQVFIFFLV